MSKRKGSTLNRPSKRHKGNDYYDGKTELEREMAALDAHEREQEELAYQQAEEQLQIPASNNQPGINYGTSDEDDADAIELSDEDYNQGMEIINECKDKSLLLIIKYKNKNLNRIASKKHDS